MDDATGEAEGMGLRVAFDRRLKLEFHGATVTSDAGLLAFGELDDALGLTEMAAEVLADTRTGRNGRHSLIAQLRQSVFGRLAGYEDVNDADRLGRDPAMRWIVGGRAVTEHAASTSQMGRFETGAMTSTPNLTALADLSGRWIDRVQTRRRGTALVLDIDSSVSPTYGTQEGTAYNGHFACTCYHPLFVFNQDGDLERCALRPGNVHSAHGWREVLDPVVARYRGQALRRLLRGDAAFALPDVYEYLEAEGFRYAIRLPANQVLQNRIAYLLTRPVGRPPHYVRRFYASFRYQAQSWCRARRVVAKVEWHPASSTRASASSSRTSAAQPGGSSPSTTGAGRPNSGSRRGSTRPSGRGCRARPSAPTPSGSNSTRSPTTWPTSSARSPCQVRSRSGR